jgi:hypothetical protein
MAVYVNQREILPSPFKMLRERASLDLVGMADAIRVKPSMLSDLESDDWDKVTLGAPLAVELLARVACVSSARLAVPSVGGDDLGNAWQEPIMELGNSFNFAAV